MLDIEEIVGNEPDKSLEMVLDWLFVFEEIVTVLQFLRVAAFKGVDVEICRLCVVVEPKEVEAG